MICMAIKSNLCTSRYGDGGGGTDEPFYGILLFGICICICILFYFPFGAGIDILRID